MIRLGRVLLTGILFALPAAAQLQQASALFAQGDYAGAKKLLSPSSPDPQALFLLGRIAMEENDAEKAAGYLEKAIARKSGVAEYHYWLGSAYGVQAQSASMFRQASLAGKVREEFERAVQLDPNLTNARYGLIDFYTMAPGFMGGSEEKALQQASEIKKRDAIEGHRAYARVYQRQKKMDLARKEWQDAVREHPESARAHAGLGAFLGVNEKSYKQGLDELEAAVKLDPQYMPAWFRIGQIAALSGANSVRGEEALKKYLTYRPNDNEPDIASTHYFLGMLYEKQGKKPEARQAYATALKLRPQVKAFSEAVKRVS